MHLNTYVYLEDWFMAKGGFPGVGGMGGMM